MRTAILIVLMGIFSVTCFAKTVVIYKTDTKEVYSLSDQDDAVLPSGYTKVILKEDFRDSGFTYPAAWYKYQSGKFVLDMKKVEAASRTESEAREKLEEEALIQKKIRKIAADQLKSENVALKYQEE